MQVNPDKLTSGEKTKIFLLKWMEMIEIVKLKFN